MNADAVTKRRFGVPAKKHDPVSKTWMEIPREYSLALGREAKARGIKKHELVLEKLRQADQCFPMMREIVPKIDALAARQGKTRYEMIMWLMNYAVNNAGRMGL